MRTGPLGSAPDIPREEIHHGTERQQNLGAGQVTVLGYPQFLARFSQTHHQNVRGCLAYLPGELAGSCGIAQRGPVRCPPSHHRQLRPLCLQFPGNQFLSLLRPTQETESQPPSRCAGQEGVYEVASGKPGPRFGCEAPGLGGQGCAVDQGQPFNGRRLVQSANPAASGSKMPDVVQICGANAQRWPTGGAGTSKNFPKCAVSLHKPHRDSAQIHPGRLRLRHLGWGHTVVPLTLEFADGGAASGVKVGDCPVEEISHGHNLR